jgi:hypothetical protein
MHKRMLQMSQRVQALGAAASPRMRELLHLAQANDAYWHGLFGGTYLPHLRRAVWSALVELEALLDAAAHRTERKVDLDLDGHAELFIGNGVLQAVVRDDGLGAVHELDAYALRHNFGDTLARRTEHYYRKIREGAHEQHHEGGGIASAHDRVRFRHPVAPEDLLPDPLPRAMFIDRREGTPLRYRVESHAEHSITLAAEGATKQLRVDGDVLEVRYRHTPAGTVETEINLAMPSCDGFLGCYVLGEATPGGFGDPFEWQDLGSLVLRDGVLKGRIELQAEPPVSMRVAPHKTVSQSEDGFEKIMQAVTLCVRHPPSGELVLRLKVVPEAGGNPA